MYETLAQERPPRLPLSSVLSVVFQGSWVVSHLEVVGGELQHVPQDIADDLGLLLDQDALIVQGVHHLRSDLQTDRDRDRERVRERERERERDRDQLKCMRQEAP